jgi:hypothetical protein
MSNEERKSRIRKAFDALNGGNPAEWLGLFGDSVVWKATPTDVFPRRVEGKDQVIQKLFMPLGEKLAGPPKLFIDDLIAEGDRVAVVAHGEATTKKGEAYNQSYCFVFRFAGDQIVEVDEHLDSALVNRVLA